MVSSWIEEELQTVDLKDGRLNRRFCKLLEALSLRPNVSIPAACGGYAETAAAYRFFDHKRVGFDEVLSPHCTQTLERITHQELVILAQDTTDIDLTRPTQAVVGAGPLDKGARRGLLLHPLVAFTPNEVPLGTVHATTLIREDGKPKKDRKERAELPIEEKESHRWLETIRIAKETARKIPNTEMVCVADSESDIDEVITEASSEDIENFHWIIRAGHNRSLSKKARKAAEARESAPCPALVREMVMATDVLYTQTINVRGRTSKVACETRGRRQSRQPRTAEVEVRAAPLTLRAPPRPDRKLPDVALNVVLIQEINPPAKDAEVEWVLLTSLPIDSVELVRLIVQFYTIRWLIEIFFRILKSGCRVEERLFEHVDRILPCLAIYMITAWRTAYVSRLARDTPDVSCEVVFEPAEWKGVYQLVKRKAPPKKPPLLMEMVKLVAQLGGYMNRSRDAVPGPQTIWLGLQRLHDIAACWLAFGPDARGRPKDM